MDVQAYPLVGIGLYTPTEASVLTGVPVSSLRRWLQGYKYDRAGEERSSLPVWRRDLEHLDALTVTFLDMMEGRFIDAFRRHHVTWPFIRAAAKLACEMFGGQHPFTRGKFRTDGRRIFHQIEDAGEVKLFDMNRKSWVFNDIVAPSLFAGVEFEDDQAARWFPMHPNKSVVIDPRIAFGRPTLFREGIPTDVLAAAVEAHEGNIQTVANWYGLSRRSVRSASQFEKRAARPTA
jgi:uncharacterized protein (DUF433 family)